MVIVAVVVAGGGGGVAAVCVVATVAVALGCARCLCLGLWAAFLAVVAVVGVVALVGVVAVVVVAGALAVWLEVEEAAPHALTSKASKTAAAGLRTNFMAVSLNPPVFVACLLRTPYGAGCFPRWGGGSEQPVNAPVAPSIRRADAATIR